MKNNLKGISQKPILILLSAYIILGIILVAVIAANLFKTPILKSPTIPSLNTSRLNVVYKSLSQREKLDYEKSVINLDVYPFGKKEPFNEFSESATQSSQTR